MSDVFISYGHSTLKQTLQVADALRGLGYDVWLDDQLPAHRAYTDVIEERLKAAKAIVVIWSAEAAKSHWVRAEANTALEANTLVQLTVDGVMPPMPFNQIQCADLAGWTGDIDAPGWRKVVTSVADLVGGTGAAPTSAAAPSVADAPLPMPSKPSIAVMPFANLSGDPEQDYFADGMVVEIVEALSRIRSIFVIASGSSLSFKGKGIGAQEAARQLGVRYVLEGSVRKAGGRVRIGVQLIDAADGAQIWTHRFEDTLEDVFALQDSVALAVAGKIEPTVRQAEIRRASARPTDNLSSYDLYLRAIPLQRTLVRANMLEALDLASRAITLDPDFGPALALAAICHRIIMVNGWSDDLEGHHRLGLELAHRALKAAGDDAAVLASVAASLDFLEDDYGAAVALLERALTLNPGCASAWFRSGIVRVRAGGTDAAIENFRTALRLDPLGPLQPSAMGGIGRALFQQGRFSEAVPLLKEHAQHVDAPLPQAFLAASYGHLAQSGEAQGALAHYRALSSQPLDAFAANWVRDPAQRKLFLDGIAMAEGKMPPDAATDG
ncbi:MAG TPA: TIR domain-containing protein [Caulobacteraceae bacterium]|nr:TIR domain-containing protein [Caulobacteraceae bacterium]